MPLRYKETIPSSLTCSLTVSCRSPTASCTIKATPRSAPWSILFAILRSCGGDWSPVKPLRLTGCREQVQVESSVALKKKLDEIHERWRSARGARRLMPLRRMRRNLGKERFEALDKLKLKDQGDARVMLLAADPVTGVAIYDSMYDELEDRERSITSQLISRTMMQNREQDGGAGDMDENEMGGLANQYLLALSKQAEDMDEESVEDAKPQETISSAPSEKEIVEDQDDPTTMYLPAWKLKDESREVISRVHDQEQGIMGTAAILVIGDEFISAEVRSW